MPEKGCERLLLQVMWHLGFRNSSLTAGVIVLRGSHPQC